MQKGHLITKSTTQHFTSTQKDYLNSFTFLFSHNNLPRFQSVPKYIHCALSYLMCQWYFLYSEMKKEFFHSLNFIIFYWTVHQVLSRLWNNYFSGLAPRYIGSKSFITALYQLQGSASFRLSHKPSALDMRKIYRPIPANIFFLYPKVCRVFSQDSILV